MSYNNFKPTYWSKYYQVENEKFCVLSKLCDYKFDKEVKHGEKLKILGTGRPTIKNYTGADIDTAEEVNDSSVFLEVDQAKYFNYQIKDIDKAQMKEGLMQTLASETVKAIAETKDSFLAQLMGTQANGLNAAAGAQLNTQALIKAAVDNAFIWLWDNSVRFNDEVFIVLKPWAYSLFKNELIELKTSNDALIREGVLGLYNNAKVYMSNNLYSITDAGKTNDCMLIGTTKAAAFASAIDETEPYRIEKNFSDAVKGLNVYGGKMVRPKELYVIRGRLTA